MGARGPKPLPENVHALRGNPSKKRLNELGTVQPEVEIPSCPTHLLPEARKEWRRITPELEALGLIARIDRAALALYCQAWARWVWCELRLKRDMELAEQRRAAAEEKGEAYTGGDGFTVPTPNGSFTYSPYWVGANKAADQVDKFLASFGMSPSSRSRVTSSESYPWLPGMGPNESGKPGEAKSAPIRSLADFAKPAA